MKKKTYRFVRQSLTAALISATLLTGCGKKGSAAGSPQNDVEILSEESTEAEDSYSGEPETISAMEEGEKVSPYYGIMHAVVLDVDVISQGETVYTFKDKADPDNAWSVGNLDIRDISIDLTPGIEAAILFHGDIIHDSENVEFISVLPDGVFRLGRASGVTLSNMMSTFSIKGMDGLEYHFIKDNCPIESGALTAESGDKVIVYYAQSPMGECYPMRILKAH